MLETAGTDQTFEKKLQETVTTARRSGSIERCRIFLVFSMRLHVCNTQYCQDLSIRLSVRPSVCQTRALWQKEKL